jgi:hypothetical protein
LLSQIPPLVPLEVTNNLGCMLFGMNEFGFSLVFCLSEVAEGLTQT